MSSSTSATGCFSLEAIEQLQQRLEQAQLLRAVAPIRRRVAVVKPRQQSRKLPAAARRQRVQRRVPLAHERPQRAQQWRVRQLGLPLLDRLAAQDKRVLCQQPVFEFADQTSLADTGVTAEQNQHWPPGRCLPPRQLELRQFPDPAHEVAACEPRAHAPKYRRNPRTAAARDRRLGISAAMNSVLRGPPDILSPC